MANTISQIQTSVTNEGFETIAAMIGLGTTFTISTFRLTNLGDTTYYEARKVYDALDPDAYHMPYTAAEFETDHGLGAIDLSAHGLSDSDGYITINTVEMADVLTVEINCYVPPTAGTSFACNEIMVYTGSGTLADPYKSFIWGIFPEITKQEKYGVNFRVLLQF